MNVERLSHRTIPLMLAIVLFVNPVNGLEMQVAGCKSLLSWASWLSDLSVTGSWHNIGPSIPADRRTRLNETAELAILERNPITGVCNCCTVVLYRKGELESIKFTRRAKSMSVLVADMSLLVRATKALTEADIVAMRDEILLQSHNSSYAHAQRRVDLPADGGVRRQLGIDLMVVHTGRRKFDGELEVTLFRFPE